MMVPHPSWWSGALCGREAQLPPRPPSLLSPADHRNSPYLGYTHSFAYSPGAPAWGPLGQTYLSLSSGPKVHLTELHGLFQRSLLIHLGKEMPEVRGPVPWNLQTSSYEDPGSLGRCPSISRVRPPRATALVHLSMPRSFLWQCYYILRS